MSSRRIQLLFAALITFVLLALVVALFLVPIPAIQGGIVGGLIGLLSSQAALFVSRYLRERGEVLFEVKGWVGSSRTFSSEEDISQASDDSLEHVSENRVFEVRFRNTKDVAVSLWDFSVVFWRGEERVSSLTPIIALTGLDLDLLNIPPQEAVVYIVRVSATGPDELQQVWKADEVEMTATVAGEGARSRKLPHWSNPDIRR